MADMLGKATSRELEDLYTQLCFMTKEEREKKPFALFVASKGMLNGEQAFQYLKAKLNEG